MRNKLLGAVFALAGVGNAVGTIAGQAIQGDSRFAVFARALLERGVYPPPSQFEAAFLSAAHTESDIERTVDAAVKALKI